jgi:hypothetical protein
MLMIWLLLRQRAAKSGALDARLQISLFVKLKLAICARPDLRAGFLFVGRAPCGARALRFCMTSALREAPRIVLHIVLNNAARFFQAGTPCVFRMAVARRLGTASRRMCLCARPWFDDARANARALPMRLVIQTNGPHPEERSPFASRRQALTMRLEIQTNGPYPEERSS